MYLLPLGVIGRWPIRSIPPLASQEWGEEWQLLIIALGRCADTLDMFSPVNGLTILLLFTQCIIYSLASCIGQARPVLSCKSLSNINITYIYLNIIG